MGDAIISRASKNGNVNIVQEIGDSETSVMSQKAATDGLAKKVDTVEGKGLSTEDFTTEEKTKLANIPDKIPKVNIVQTTGTSQTDVMSQKAVSENICFGRGTLDTGDFNITLGNSAESTGTGNITIGDNATTNNADHSEGYYDDCLSIGTQASVTRFGGTSIGGYAKCIGERSVALGYGSKAKEDYVVSVSDPNFVIKRRIVNVGDPINDQDATTKSYVDNKIAESGGESSVTIVQTTGKSETDVISQKGSTDSFAFKSHEHSAEDIVSGIISVANGGTGASTAQLARKNLNVPYLASTYYTGDLNDLKDTGFYTISYSGTTNAPPTKNATPSWLLMVISSNATSLNVGTFQVCSEVFNTKQASMWIRKYDGISSSSWTEWENINYTSDTSLLRCISDSISLYVNTSGNDATGNGSKNNPYATVTKALSNFRGKYMTSAVNIYIEQGNYDEALDLSNFYGSGSLRILGYNSKSSRFNSCTIDNNYLRSIEIHYVDIGTDSKASTIYIRENIAYLSLYKVTFTKASILSSTSNIIFSNCSFSDATTAISVYPRGGVGGMGYDGVGKIILKDTNTFTNVTTAVSVSGGCTLIQSTLPTLNGATLKKSTGGMIIYPNGTFNAS